MMIEINRISPCETRMPLSRHKDLNTKECLVLRSRIFVADLSWRSLKSEDGRRSSEVRAMLKMRMQMEDDSTKLITGKIEPLEDIRRPTLSHASNYIESYQVTCYNTDRCATLL